MATHWNSKGEIDGYMSKFWGLFLMPLVITGLASLEGSYLKLQG